MIVQGFGECPKLEFSLGWYDASESIRWHTDDDSLRLESRRPEPAPAQAGVAAEKKAWNARCDPGVLPLP